MAKGIKQNTAGLSERRHGRGRLREILVLCSPSRKDGHRVSVAAPGSRSHALSISRFS